MRMERGLYNNNRRADAAEIALDCVAAISRGELASCGPAEILALSPRRARLFYPTRGGSANHL